MYTIGSRWFQLDTTQVDFYFTLLQLPRSLWRRQTEMWAIFRKGNKGPNLTIQSPHFQMEKERHKYGCLTYNRPPILNIMNWWIIAESKQQRLAQKFKMSTRKIIFTIKNWTITNSSVKVKETNFLYILIMHLKLNILH